MGSLLSRRSTEYGSCCFVCRLVRKWSSAACKITLVLPTKTSRHSHKNTEKRSQEDCGGRNKVPCTIFVGEEEGG